MSPPCFQRAYTVASRVKTVPPSTCSPPSLAVNQPSKVWPARVGVGSAASLWPWVVCVEAPAAMFPPLGSKVMVSSWPGPGFPPSPSLIQYA